MAAPTDFIGGLSAPLKVNHQTASYTLDLVDRGQLVLFDGASTQTCTIPPHSSVGFIAGTAVKVIWGSGAGEVKIAAGAGVTIITPAGLNLSSGGSVWLTQTHTIDTWEISGDLQQQRVLRTVAGTTDTPSHADLGKLIQFTSASAVTMTLANSGFTALDWFDFYQDGAGTVTVASADTVLPGVGALRTQGSAGTAIYLGSSKWLLIGDFAKTSFRIIAAISSPQTAGAIAGNDYVFFISGTTTLTLPTAVGNTCRYTVKNTGSGVVSIASTSAQTFDGTATPITVAVGSSLDLISDNANWQIV